MIETVFNFNHNQLCLGIIASGIGFVLAQKILSDFVTSAGGFGPTWCWSLSHCHRMWRS